MKSDFVEQRGGEPAGVGAVVERPPHQATRGKRGWARGWIVLGVAAVALFLSAPGQTYSISAFVDPMLAELRLGRSSFSISYLMGTVAAGMLLPTIGRWTDRYGARIVIPAAAVGLGASCFVMAGVRGWIGLTVGFVLTRTLGQGTLMLTSTWLVGHWFDRRRGFAMGLLAVGGTSSVMVMPIVNQWWIEEWGWRWTWAALGALVLAALVLPAAWLLRDRPEDVGLRPDGDPPDDADDTPFGGAADPRRMGYRAEEALRQATFWKLMSVVATSALVGTGLMFHQVSMLGDRGVAARDALGLIGFQAMMATAMSLGGGWLVDRVAPRYLLAACMGMLSMCLVVLVVMWHPVMAVLYAALLGMHGGLIRTSGMVIWAKYFGRVELGRIQGYAMTAMVFTSAAGPLPLALAKDYLGRYEWALVGLMVLPACAIWLVLSVRPPEKLPVVE